MSGSLLEKRALQTAVGLAALLPIVAGAWDVLHALAGASSWSVSHDRYLSGLLMAIGIAFWSTISDIEAKTNRFRMLTFIVVIGGLCRLLGVVLGDDLSPQVVAALAMELGVTPALCLWQSQRIRRAADSQSGPASFLPQFDS